MQAEALQALFVYLEYLSGEKRLSVHTLTNYKRDLMRLRSYCTEQKIKNWQQLESSDIRAYIGIRRKVNICGRSIQRELAAIRSFYRFLLKNQLVEHNPLQDIRAPKSAKRLPKILDVDQVASMLDAKPDMHLEVRDLAMFELFYSSGLRLSELVMLDLGDIALVDGYLLVRFGKGNKQRQVPIGQKAITAINNWLNLRPNVASKALFISMRGARLGQRSVQLRLERWCIKLNLTENVHPHMLRHSFASHLLESSQDIRAVQELLGHSNVSTTQIYTHLDFQHLSNIYDNAHPRARKKPTKIESLS